MREEWNSLLEKTGMNNPFLRHEWLSAWWKGYGKDKELFVLRFRKEEKSIGFIPLMKYKTKLAGLPIEAIGFIANHWTPMNLILSDYKEACIEEMMDLFITTKRIFILSNMDAESDRFVYLKRLLVSKKNMFYETSRKTAYIVNEGGWEQYLKNKSHNFRADFGKKLRRLNKIGSVTLTQTLGETKNVVSALETVAAKYAQVHDKERIINSSSGKVFYREIIDKWKEEDRIDCTFLKVDNKPIAYMVGVKDNGSYFAFDTAYDPAFEKYSPGMIIHNLLLETLFNNGTKKFDFGYITDYKKRWTEQVSVMTDITIFPKGPVGTLLWTANRAKERFVKKNYENQ